MLLSSLFSTPAPVDDVPPNADVLAKAMALSLQDASGQEHTLASIVGKHQRTVLVFIRHHHCGFCVEYVRACGENAKMKATTGSGAEGAQVVVIGHGSWEGITRHKQVSNSPFEMYVDSGKELYKTLGLTRRNMGKMLETKEVSAACGTGWTGPAQLIPPRSLQPAYFQGSSSLSLVLSSFYEAVGSGLLALKGGEIALLGGEFVLEGGEWARGDVEMAAHC